MEALERTFQLARGIGPWRERDLWARGLFTWADFEAAASKGVVMATRLDRALGEAIERARAALADRDLAALAAAVPPKEHWRLYQPFAEEAAFFDIEADGEKAPTIVAVMDRRGVASFRRGRGLDELPARLAESRIWVTFNGGAFDLPVLRQTFGARFPQPVVHVDLRFLARQAKLKGGLKGIEKQLGLGRPPHLEGVQGFDAIRLWREWTVNHELEALRILIEYNLYDAVNLRSVLEWSGWRIGELNGWEVERGRIFERGDVLYDISRVVLESAETAESPESAG